MPLLRIRFKANPTDPRPVNFPLPHPYWITGGGDTYSWVVAYANDVDFIYLNWPEAKDLTVDEVEGYEFTDRFQKPEWFKEPA